MQRSRRSRGEEVQTLPSLVALFDWLLKGDAGRRALLGATMPMPLRAQGKSPMFPHAEAGAWTWARVEAFVKDTPRHAEWGLLLDAVVAVDADDAETVAWLESLQDPDVRAALDVCPVQATRKGRHYLFLRPAWADDEGYWDGARQVADRAVDLKTRCSTGTRGVLVVAPSANKAWVRAPWDDGAAMVEIPRALLELVAAPRRVSAPAVQKKAPTFEEPLVLPDMQTPSPRSAPPTTEPAMPKDDVEALLLLLGKARWDNRSDWRDIATALKNYSGDAHRDSWVRMSRISPKFTEAEAIKLWNTVARSTFAGAKIGIGSIHRMAMKDDPLRYAEYRAARVPEVVLRRWNEGDRGLADIAHFALKDQLKRVGQAVYFFDEALCHWMKGTEGSVRRKVSVAVEEYLRDVEMYFVARSRAEPDEAARKLLDDKKAAVAKRIAHVQQHAGMAGITSQTTFLCADDDFEQQLDGHPHLLGVKNGVVDLRIGELRDRRPEDMIFAVVDTDYDPDASPALMEATVLAAMADDPHMAAFMRKLMGYAITGEVCEELFVVFTGSGRNAKGVIVQTVEALLGRRLLKMLKSALIVDAQVSNIDAERAELMGARIAVFNELRPGDKLKTNEVQVLSGGDGIPATRKYMDPMVIQPRHQCILTTNHMPELSVVIPAIVERLMCVHFPVTFVDLEPGEAPSVFRRQRDNALKARLRADLTGALKWLVDGAVEWYATRDLKASAPAKVKEFSRAYMDEHDVVGRFVRECCVVGPDARVASSDMTASFTAWARNNAVGQVGLVKALETKGFVKKPVRIVGNAGTVQGYLGIGIRPTD
jgi:putative DNA primase/helicase